MIECYLKENKNRVESVTQSNTLIFNSTLFMIISILFCVVFEQKPWQLVFFWIKKFATMSFSSFIRTSD